MTRLERIILRSPPIAFLLKKSQSWVLPGFRGFPLYDVGNYYLKQVEKIGLYERAAAISFNLVMALPAAVLFLFTLIPYFPESDKLRGEILRLFRNISPNKTTYGFISDILELLEKQHVGLFSFGFVLLIFYSSNAMMGVIRTFDKSIKEKTGHFLHRRFRAIRITFILMVLVLISSLLLFVSREQIESILRKVFHAKREGMKTFYFWWGWVRWAAIISLLFYGISLVYKFAPSVKKRWRLLSAGSVLATLLTLTTTILFSYWVNNFGSYNKIYGSIGTVMIFMILIYINSLILLIGFELNVTIVYLTKEAEERKLKEAGHQH
ncbi:MAG: YihY/virulence factor BrkB family protein [Sediminibacterium sp.]